LKNLRHLRLSFGATFLWLAVAANTAIGQALTTVNFDSGGQMVYDQNLITPTLLTAGPTGDGNGAVIQLGYYSAATISNNFAGTWIPLTGQTSPNTAIVTGSTEMYNQTSIGDTTMNVGLSGNGVFAIGVNFRPGDPTAGNNLPTSTTIPLAIRFYNGTSIASSTFYNVVSDDGWLWRTPSNPPTNPVIPISLDDQNPDLEWLSIAQGQSANTAFHTTISLAAVPEPATVGVGILCAASLFGSALLRRARRKP
jgi:hypothetical protein